MESKLYLEDLPEWIKEEISLLYKLGIEIEELEYIIEVRLKEIDYN